METEKNKKVYRHPFVYSHPGCDHCSFQDGNGVCGALRAETELDHHWKCYIHDVVGNGEFNCSEPHDKNA